MYSLPNKRIVLAITGSIAAYKAAVLLRILQNYGVQVKVVMSTSACNFISPLTFQALTGEAVVIDHHEADNAMAHINLSRWADIILIAPASADCIARLALGRANDLLSALCLASSADIALAPAMNQKMWQNSATKAHIKTLHTNGLHIFSPADGEQACGEIGAGRMMEPEDIAQAISELFETGLLAGKSILLSAGPTCEPIDPMRFLTNRSSGKMGYALAQAAVDMGAKVTLVSGPVHLVPPDRVTCIQVETTEQMLDAVLLHAKNVDWFIGVAAVADYRPANPSAHKIKSMNDTANIELIKTPDILKTIAICRHRPKLVVGFAAETDNMEQYAKAKLKAKQIDAIIMNEIGQGIGVGVDENKVNIIWKNGHKIYPLNSKRRIAVEILQTLYQIEIADLTNEIHTN